MMELLGLYKNVFWLILVASLILPLIGMHLPARGQTVQSLMLSQLSILGVLLGLLFKEIFSLRDDSFGLFLPLIMGVALSFGVQWQLFDLKRKLDEALFLTLFLMAMASCYWLKTFFPILESHHSQTYFGDLVTISGGELFFATIILGATLIFYYFHHRLFLKQSFEREIFGRQWKSQDQKRRIFEILAVIVMVQAIYSLGMLFTLSFMLMAPVLLSSRSANFQNYLAKVLSCSLVAGIGGFILSLFYTRLSTVPTMVLVLVMACLLVHLVDRYRRS